MASAWRSPLFYVILAVYLLAGVLFATLTPDWQTPDEPAHYNYIRYLAQQSGFPELISRCYNQAYLEQLKSRHFPPELPLDTVCYEFHQPPLYYLLAMPIYLLSGGSLLALRLLSVGLGAGVVGLAGLVARTIFPNEPVVVFGTMALVAFVPMHTAMLASVNNDALAELILAALLLLLTRRLVLGQPDSARSDIFLGLLLGLGLITKTTVYIAIPLTAVTLWLAWVGKEQGSRGAAPTGGFAREQGSRGAYQSEGRSATDRAKFYPEWTNWSVLVKQFGLVFGLALVMALPWYVRNAVLYGNLDVLGLGRHNAIVVGQLRTVDYIAEVGWRTYFYDFITTTFQSFWGQFGWMAVPMSERVYLALTVLSLVGLGGLVGFWVLGFRFGIWDLGFGKGISSPNATRNSQSQALLLMALTIGLMFLGYTWYNLEFVQFQGRYLFPALIPLGLFFSLGLREALAPRWAWLLTGGLVLALGWVVLASLASGDLDKLAMLITGLALALAGARAWLAPRWPVPAWWLMAGVYTGLALLTLISPFWYVLPYLSP